MEQSSQIHQLDKSESIPISFDTGPVHEFRCTIAGLLKQRGGSLHLNRICADRNVSSGDELLDLFEQMSKRPRNKLLNLLQNTIHSARTS
ncbi:hypothetical protein HN512_04950 [Candidatus Peregrinibacteria bacterium]|jgi:hypothetical protein|nr:hypothetical protein [Candidatus Peregrinibacteria bacterium]MBT3599154.1 hypothetical protein [Candidatus Peregrinibacteria bacterium]MBT6730794.1 hypothetical protein [Candidatus Peregrinibacteria bacterium]MBT7008874.1 hypothetical protein [Candidatus Peregrinibacteria bacterium]MBT7344619.1 hypothetical protein [Candidatus Peregrinibacteria bacterium]